jgi:pilus assembly protein CpaC
MALRLENQGISEMFDRFARKLFFVGIAVAALAAPGIGAAVADGAPAGARPAAVSAAPLLRRVKVGLNKSLVVDLPRDARDVLDSNPGIADAVIRTPRRIYLTGVAIGQANIIVFDKAGQQIITLDLSVERDNSALQALIARFVPDSDVQVEVVNDNIILSGSVKNAADSQKVQDIAAMFANGGENTGSSPTSMTAGSSSASAGGGTNSSSTTVTGDARTSKVKNLLTIEGEDQVHLKVTVAEVDRNIGKQLGIDISSSFASGFLSGGLNTSNPFGVTNSPPSSKGTFGYDDGTSSITATLRALDQTGVIRTLAEPTLTAISGESASFLAGGEFPVPSGKDQDGNVTISYKPFGVSLSFTPVVLSEGRISLHVKTEVSDLSTENAIQLAGVSLPSIVVRRSETVMELPSGGSMVMGGLLQDSVRQAISGFPGLKDLPVLGVLFRSRDFKRNETELVIIVTPYLVKPVARTALARPDDGFNPAGDSTANFLGRVNRVYGVQGQPAPAGTYKGRYGFIFE